MANKSTVTQSITKAKKVYGNNDKDFNSMIDAYASAINGSYNRQREESNKTYAENYAKADNEALSRGMGRSSYNLQTLANINSEKAKAASSIWDKQSEDVLKYASTLQQFMKEIELKNRELDLQQQQINLQKGAGGGGGRRGNGKGNGNGNGDGDEGNGVDKALTEYMKNRAGGSILQTLGYTKNNNTTANNNSVLKNPKKSNRQVL